MATPTVTSIGAEAVGFDAGADAAFAFAAVVAAVVVSVVLAVVLCTDAVWFVLNMPISGDEGTDELVALAVWFPAACAIGTASA